MQHDDSHIIHVLLYRYLNSRLLLYLYTLYFGRPAPPTLLVAAKKKFSRRCYADQSIPNQTLPCWVKFQFFIYFPSDLVCTYLTHSVLSPPSIPVSVTRSVPCVNLYDSYRCSPDAIDLMLLRKRYSKFDPPYLGNVKQRSLLWF